MYVICELHVVVISGISQPARGEDMGSVAGLVYRLRHSYFFHGGHRDVSLVLPGQDGQRSGRRGD